MDIIRLWRGGIENEDGYLLEPLLFSWLDGLRQLKELEASEEAVSEVRSAIQKVEEKLRSPGDKKFNWYGIPRAIGILVNGLTRDDFERLQKLYFTAWEQGGTGASWARFELLGMIAVNASPENLPFWKQALALAKPKEYRPHDRYALVLAGLTILALEHPESEAEASLVAALDHPEETARSVAAQMLTLLYRQRGTEAPAALHEVIGRSMSSKARLIMRLGEVRTAMSNGRRPRLENPDGVYVFEVHHRLAKSVQRTIAIRSKQTFERLHRAIQDAFDWGQDHMYAFFLSGRAWDRTSEIDMEGESDFHFENLLEFARLLDPDSDSVPAPRERRQAAGEPTTVFNTRIGALGFEKGDRFLYLFDFGDDHEFEVTCVDVRATAEPGRYPRLIASKGSGIEQYPDYEE